MERRRIILNAVCLLLTLTQLNSLCAQINWGSGNPESELIESRVQGKALSLPPSVVKANDLVELSTNELKVLLSINYLEYAFLKPVKITDKDRAFLVDHFLKRSDSLVKSKFEGVDNLPSSNFKNLSMFIELNFASTSRKKTAIDDGFRIWYSKTTDVLLEDLSHEQKLGVISKSIASLKSDLLFSRGFVRGY